MKPKSEPNVWSQVEVLDKPSQINKGLKGSGDFEFTGTLVFGGQWTGTIRSEDPKALLEVMPGAQIRGRIAVPTVVAHGQLPDVEIEAKKFIASSGSHITGRVKAEKFIIQEGAIVEGRITSAQLPKMGFDRQV